MTEPLQPGFLLSELAAWREAPRWWIALSGGVDSCVLLQLLAELRRQHELPPLTAIHVNHGLQAEAASWAQHCEDLCLASGVPLELRQASVNDTGEGPEAAARQVRYQVFESLLGEGELLLQAHHLDDQVETFFLRLMRGAGARGLAGMPASRPLGAGWLARPLLAVPRAGIEAFAADRDLHWVDDPSNTDTAMDRNFLRHRVLPQLAERWPGYRDSVRRSMEALAAAERELEATDLERLAQSRGQAFGEPTLDLARLAPASELNLARDLRRWLRTEDRPAPPQARLLEFARQLREGRGDSQPALDLGDFSLRRYRDRVYLVPLKPDAPPESIELAPDSAVSIAGWGEIALKPCAGPGLRLPAAGAWTLRWRVGGERCRPLGRSGSQSLKKLLQEAAVPPWCREQLPLLYAGDELAAVADLWICEGHAAGPGETAYQLVWRTGPAAALD